MQWDAGDPLATLPIEPRSRRDLNFEIRMGVLSAELRDTFHAWRKVFIGKEEAIGQWGRNSGMKGPLPRRGCPWPPEPEMWYSL